MINPLDLPGPQFLLFYAVVGLLTLIVVWMAQKAREGGVAPRVDLPDPYLIACLRGGAAEAARIAAVSLIDRGLIVAKNKYLARATTRPGTLTALERAVFEVVPTTGVTMHDVVTARRVLAACEPYQRTLVHHGLIPDAAMRAARLRWRLAALALLIGLAGVKINVALGRGRTNIVFLIVLAIVFAVVAMVITARKRTVRGTAFLQDLRLLFNRLRQRVASLEPGTATPDLTLAAAVFGLAVLPSSRFTYISTLFPYTSNPSASCGSSSGGCGGGSGGGCGGGGCGGCGGGGGD